MDSLSEPLLIRKIDQRPRMVQRNYLEKAQTTTKIKQLTNKSCARHGFRVTENEQRNMVNCTNYIGGIAFSHQDDPICKNKKEKRDN